MVRLRVLLFPVLQYSSTPLLQLSSTPILHYSITPLLQLSITGTQIAGSLEDIERP
jgi:hypothetical protein